MRTRKNPKEVRVSARISEEDKNILKKTKVNPAEAIHYYCRHMQNKSEILKLRKQNIMNDLTELKLDEIVLEQELEEIDAALSKLDESELKTEEALVEEWVNNSVSIIMNLNLDCDLEHLFMNPDVIRYLDEHAKRCNEDVVVYIKKVKAAYEKCLTSESDTSAKVPIRQNV